MSYERSCSPTYFLIKKIALGQIYGYVTNT